MKTVGKLNNFHVVEAKVNVKNNSARRVELLEGAVAIFEIKVDGEPYSVEDWFFENVNDFLFEQDDWGHLGQYDPSVHSEILAVSGVYHGGWFFDAKEESERQFVFYVPCLYQQLEAKLLLPQTISSNEYLWANWSVHKVITDNYRDDQIEVTYQRSSLACRWFGVFCDQSDELNPNNESDKEYIDKNIYVQRDNFVLLLPEMKCKKSDDAEISPNADTGKLVDDKPPN
jgi:hypothetical protein